MKIVLLPYEFPQTRLGGIARISFEIGKALVKQGHEVIAILNDNSLIFNPHHRRDEIEGIKCIYLKPGINIFPEYNIFANSYKAFEFMINENIKPNIIMAWLPSCIAFNKYKINPLFKNTKFVAFQYETGIMDFKAKLKDLLNHFSPRAIVETIGSLVFAIPEKKYLSAADCIITEDHETKRWLHRMGLKKIKVIPSGIDIRKYSKGNRESIRKEYNIKGNEKLIIHFGRCNPRKGIQYIIKAMPTLIKYNNVKLLICGGGRYGYKSILEKLTKKLGLNKQVIFTGQIGTNEQDYYAAADVVCISSLSEGIPQTLMEAMASGKPVACSKLPGIWAFIPNKSMVNWIEPGNVDSVALAINGILSHYEQAKRRAKLNQSWIKRFTWDKVVRRILKEI